MPGEVPVWWRNRLVVIPEWHTKDGRVATMTVFELSPEEIAEYARDDGDAKGGA